MGYLGISHKWLAKIHFLNRAFSDKNNTLHNKNESRQIYNRNVKAGGKNYKMVNWCDGYFLYRIAWILKGKKNLFSQGDKEMQRLRWICETLMQMWYISKGRQKILRRLKMLHGDLNVFENTADKQGACKYNIRKWNHIFKDLTSAD